MKRVSIVILMILMVQGISAQDNEKAEEKKFGVKISGFVKNDFFYDTRQTVAAREGHFLLWPAPVNLDENGEDINSGANFNMLALQSRLSVAISGPDAFGAKTSGLIEGDFFAQSNDNINLFRLRHAFLKLSWTHIEVLAGQYWGPLFVTDCFPGTVSFNTGTPMQSFSRHPQIRVAFNTGGLKVTAAALSQRDYSNVGPSGASSSYLRNSAIPDMHLQAQYGFSSESGTGLVAGAGVAYKTLVPRLSSTTLAGTYKVDEKVGGLTAIGFAKLTLKPVTVKLQARYGENISDILAISGFAVTDIPDPITGEAIYSPLKGMTVWGEVHTNGNPQVGVFGGLTMNNGTKDEMGSLLYPVYGRGTNIRSLYRIAPRVIYNAGKVRLALELEYTSAAYGENYDTFYIPDQTTAANNLRTLLAIYYFF
ncbi:MAG: hypothetical protein GY790_01430 [Bacteroidetes bacterium]|nr:hypothetical protein [Bacteroidota bacterium]